MLYFSVMELLALLLNLVFSSFKPGLSTSSPPLFLYQLRVKVLDFLLNRSKGLVSIGPKVSLGLSLILGIIYPIFAGKHLLDGLHKGKK